MEAMFLKNLQFMKPPTSSTHASPTPFDLECATAQPNEPSGSNWSDGVDNSVWYTFVAPASGSVEIETVEGPNGESFDTQLALYVVDGVVSDFSTFVELASDDDGGSSFEFASLVVAEVSPGATCYVQVDGWLSRRCRHRTAGNS